MLTFREDEIVSSTEIVRDFKGCREKAKELSKVIIFKNNTPDLALVDYKEYSRLVALAMMLDDIEIAHMIEERDKKDSGRRHTTEEVRARRNALKQKQITEVCD